MGTSCLPRLSRSLKQLALFCPFDIQCAIRLTSSSLLPKLVLSVPGKRISGSFAKFHVIRENQRAETERNLLITKTRK